jgi:hypothetical protein
MKLPTSEELQALRKGLRRRKLPRVFDGMCCGEHGIGIAKFRASGSAFSVEWERFDGNQHAAPTHADWESLCSDPRLEMQRLEVGMVISESLEAKGKRVMDSIGHPIAAFNEAKPYFDAADKWRHWAIVKAGHMLGLASTGPGRT